jgi:hypothetical protein
VTAWIAAHLAIGIALAALCFAGGIFLLAFAFRLGGKS